MDSFEEADLLRAAQADDPAAKEKLFKAFAHIIPIIAAEYFGPLRDDRLAAGNLGLAKAIRGYDWRRNNRFQVYAERYIRGEIQKLVNDWHPIQLRLKHVRRDLRQTLRPSQCYRSFCP